MEGTLGLKIRLRFFLRSVKIAYSRAAWIPPGSDAAADGESDAATARAAAICRRDSFSRESPAYSGDHPAPQRRVQPASHAAEQAPSETFSRHSCAAARSK